jgi:osmotically-inducible protein OsmY
MNTRFNKFILAAALASGLAAAAVPAIAQSPVPMSGDDTVLVEQVKAALAQSRPLKDADVDIAVSATQGVVHLSGWLAYADDIQTAQNVAASVAGVKSVDARFHVWSSNGRPPSFF